MQTLIQVFCKTNFGSLRQKIADDPKLEDYHLQVVKRRKQDRPHGWLKLKSSDARGTLNIEWDGKTNVLSTRVVNKGGGKPDIISGDFISYLIGHHVKKISFINIAPIR